MQKRIKQVDKKIAYIKELKEELIKLGFKVDSDFYRINQLCLHLDK